ncbi:hypothetical protein Q3G72_026414 [Acer saccharum]|nr:hypothetical protein Q3G72_026414 [Acer saccharum]
MRITHTYSHIQGLRLIVDSYNLIKVGMNMKRNNITPLLPYADQTIRDLNEQWSYGLIECGGGYVAFGGPGGGVESESSNVAGEYVDFK